VRKGGGGVQELVCRVCRGRWRVGGGLAVRVGSMRLGQKDGSARHSGRIRRTDPPALETDPPSTTNAYSGAAIWRLFGFVLFGLVWFGLVWFGLVFPNQYSPYCCPRIRVCGTRRIRLQRGRFRPAESPRLAGGSVFLPQSLGPYSGTSRRRRHGLESSNRTHPFP